MVEHFPSTLCSSKHSTNHLKTRFSGTADNRTMGRITWYSLRRGGGPEAKPYKADSKMVAPCGFTLQNSHNCNICFHGLKDTHWPDLKVSGENTYVQVECTENVLKCFQLGYLCKADRTWSLLLSCQHHLVSALHRGLISEEFIGTS